MPQQMHAANVLKLTMVYKLTSRCLPSVSFAIDGSSDHDAARATALNFLSHAVSCIT